MQQKDIFLSYGNLFFWKLLLVVSHYHLQFLWALPIFPNHLWLQMHFRVTNASQ